MIKIGPQHIYILLIVSSINISVHGQIPELQYVSHVIIDPDKIDGETLGGFSGITFNNETQNYVLVADKPPSRLVTNTIELNSKPIINWNKTQFLSPTPMELSELEGIAYDSQTGHYFVSDEQKEGTRIMELDEQANFKRIVIPDNMPFMALSGHNSGIEGLTISNNGKYLYYAFERPVDDCQNSRTTTLGRINIATSEVVVFPYQLHEVANDRLGTNGISAILSWNDSTLLVMERAYIPNQGNIVRLYEVILNSIGIIAEMVTCDTLNVDNLQSRLVYDFGDEPEIDIDNAEGMCFNEDKSLLLIITDNNFSKKQETQLVVLEIE